MKSRKEEIKGFYGRLISLYPAEFRERFGESMKQTFNDLLNEGNAGLGFVVWQFAETSVGVCKENIARMREGEIMRKGLSNPRFSAIVAFSLILPFMVLNAIAINQIEPFSTIFRINTAGGFWDYPIGHITGIIALLFYPVGAAIAVRSMIRNRKEKGASYFINGLLAFFMIAVFSLISWALLDEIYRCNVLLIPNCD